MYQSRVGEKFLVSLQFNPCKMTIAMTFEKGASSLTGLESNQLRVTDLANTNKEELLEAKFIVTNKKGAFEVNSEKTFQPETSIELKKLIETYNKPSMWSKVMNRRNALVATFLIAASSLTTYGISSYNNSNNPEPETKNIVMTDSDEKEENMATINEESDTLSQEIKDAQKIINEEYNKIPNDIKQKANEDYIRYSNGLR